MSKDSKAQHRATRQHPPTKIIVERHYVGTGIWVYGVFTVGVLLLGIVLKLMIRKSIKK